MSIAPPWLVACAAAAVAAAASVAAPAVAAPAVVASAVAASASAAPTVAADAPMPATLHSCAPRDGLGYVCGPSGGEDLARVSGTPWLVVSGLNIGAPAHLYLVDTRARRASVLFPLGVPAMHLDETLRSGCPGPPDLARLSTDGLNLRAGHGGRHMLYVANHGDRRAIEMFAIDARGPVPTASWVGCVLLPEGTLPNAVVPLRDGGLLVTSFYDPRDRDAWMHMDRGDPTGAIWEWHAGRGLREVATGGISGANGLEVSEDQRTLYASAWSGRELLILDRRSGARRHIALGFLPDNIKRAPDGTLLIAGQRSTAAKIGACGGADCPQDWIVVRVDPDRGTVTPLLTRPGNELINYACGALDVDGMLYITARGDRRLATVTMASLPSLQ